MTEICVLEGRARSWEEALRLTAGELLRRGCVKDDFCEACIERERLYPTGLTNLCPVAIPHTTKEHVISEAICALRLKEPVEFRSIESSDVLVNVRYVLNLALLDDTAHLRLLRRLITSVKRPEFFDEIDALGLDELGDYLRANFFD